MQASGDMYILRAFAVKSPSVYLKLFDSHLVFIRMYASIVWNPCKIRDLDLLERMQNRFLRLVCLKIDVTYPSEEVENPRDYNRKGQSCFNILETTLRCYNN